MPQSSPESSLKRKRVELEDPNGDEISELDDDTESPINDDLVGDYADEPARFGTQVLPVAQLPSDYNGQPENGEQYLFFVRRDARKLPIVTRVENPFAVDIPVLCAPKNDPLPGIPSEAWHNRFCERFMALRQNLVAGDTFVQPCGENYPGAKDRDGWWKYIYGNAKPGSVQLVNQKSAVSIKQEQVTPLPENVLATEIVQDEDGYEEGENSDVEDEENDTTDLNGTEVIPTGIIERPSQVASGVKVDSLSPVKPKSTEKVGRNDARPPSLCLITHLDERTNFHLLMFFSHWIQLRLDSREALSERHGIPQAIVSPILEENESKWILSLLARLVDPLSSKQISTLRTLARSCMELMQWSNSEEDNLTLSKNIPDSGTVSCWMIITAISKGWGQFDLWEDAKLALRSRS